MENGPLAISETDEQKQILETVDIVQEVKPEINQYEIEVEPKESLVKQS